MLAQGHNSTCKHVCSVLLNRSLLGFINVLRCFFFLLIFFFFFEGIRFLNVVIFSPDNYCHVILLVTFIISPFHFVSLASFSFLSCFLDDQHLTALEKEMKKRKEEERKKERKKERNKREIIVKQSYMKENDSEWYQTIRKKGQSY